MTNLRLRTPWLLDTLDVLLQNYNLATRRYECMGTSTNLWNNDLGDNVNESLASMRQRTTSIGNEYELYNLYAKF